jgi:signal peptidase II
LDGFIGFRYATNMGAAFGIFQGGRWFFLIGTLLVFAILLYYEFKTPHNKRNLWARIPMVLIFAGGLGNFIDRLLAGYVVDMFEFLFISFPIFNVADILVVAGTFAYAFVAIFILKDSENE